MALTAHSTTFDNSSKPTKASNLTQWLDYMQQIHVSAIDMGLSRVLPVAEQLGIVQSSKSETYVFTVAGTNGKGSTTAVISEICQTAGYKTALYQSPHLIEFNERVRINGEMVSDNTLINAFCEVEAARLECQLTLSFFEMTTLAALLIFAQANCDVWVLEVGLGGRLDVVNIIDPDMAVITNIGIDHIDWLGDNVEAIGFEKAGILRDGISLIYGAKEMPDSVKTKIKQCNVTCYQVDQDFSYQAVVQDKDHAQKSDIWLYSNAALTLQLPRPRLSLANTANALSAVLASPLQINVNAIEQALDTVTLAGRFDYRQVAGRHWLLDVAHNEHGVNFLLSQLIPLWQQHSERQTKNGNDAATIKILFSMLADKDIAMVVQRLSQSGLPISAWYIAEIDYPRAASLAQLQQILTIHLPHTAIHTFDNLQHATNAIILDSQTQDLLLVCGSFHTIGEALATLTV